MALVVRAVADQHAIHIDVVQNGRPEIIGPGVLAFVEDDFDASDRPGYGRERAATARARSM
jgi:hypothetical protein